MSRLRPRELSGLVGLPLSSEQVAAATAPLEPRLLVAGAGSGKTTVMAARVVWLVATGALRPGEVLGLTFTNKAATELRSRVRLGLQRLSTDQQDGAEPTVMTYHAFAGRLLVEYGLLLGRDGTERLIGDALRSRLAYRVACRPNVPDAEIAGRYSNPYTLAARILAMDDALADLDIETSAMREWDEDLRGLLRVGDGTGSLPSRMLETSAGRTVLSRLVDQFRAQKAAHGVCDFADQARISADLVRELDAVAVSLRERFRAVLLDEYQDTSRVQRRLMQSLFGDGHPVTAVGDPCQAIYGWRGASVTNIDRFPDQFPAASGAPAEVLPLSVNRRSTVAVVALANAISVDLREVHKESRPLRAKAEAEEGHLACALLPTMDEELSWLGNRVETLGRCRSWSDLAILCRTNDQVGAVAGALAERGIPAYVAARGSLLDLPQVVDVTTLLRLMVDPTANPALLHHLVGPRRRIGPRDLAILARRAVDLSGGEGAPVCLLDAMFDPGDVTRYEFSTEARARFARFAAMLDDLRDVRDRGVAEIISTVAHRLGLGVAWESGGAVCEAVRDSIHRLMSLAEDFVDLAGSRSLAAFVAYLDDCRGFDAQPRSESPATGDAVTVMTVHGAKGLEFPVVLLPFLCERVFPAGQGRPRWPTNVVAIPPVARDEPDPAAEAGFPDDPVTGKRHRAFVEACGVADLRDEDRLAYVAVTRAQQQVYASGHWYGPTQKRPRGPSAYLRAVHRVCLGGMGTIEVWSPEPDAQSVENHRARRGTAIWPLPVQDGGLADFAARVDESVGRIECGDDLDTGGIDRRPLPDEFASLADRVDELLADARAESGEATDPEVLSASRAIAMVTDPRTRGRQSRPMPSRPSAAARNGIRFHRWVERRLGQQELFDLAEVPGAELAADDSLTDLVRGFERTEFGNRAPEATEYPFTVTLGDLVLTGRIDAVFPLRGEDVRWEVVDWKTGDPDRADPLQLAVYRYAWSLVKGVPIDAVRAAFVYLPEGAVHRPTDLPGPEELTRLLTDSVPTTVASRST